MYVPPVGVGQSGGEPSLGVDRATGNVLAQAFAETDVVVFDDSTAPATATWANVAKGPQAFVNTDPVLATDARSGRTFAGGLDGDCSVLAFTDNDGASWTTMPDACASPAFDHPTIAAGPWAGSPPAGASYPEAVYYCAQTQVDECATSLDGGVTFLPPSVLNPDARCTGLFGHVKVAPDGAVFVPVKTCGLLSPGAPQKQGVYVSTDNGLTWTTRVIPSSSVPAHWFDPTIATTPSSWAYAAWTGSDARPHAALSKDHGASWGPSADLGASVGLRASVFASAIAGDDDRASVAFLGTTDAGDAFTQSFTGTWDLYVATTFDAGATWSTVKVTSDPVQRGWICASGTTCPTNPDGSQPGRNLLDFIDATIDAQGHVLVAFADGCVAACAQPNGTIAESTTDQLEIARQSGGDCLLSALCGPASGTPAGGPPSGGDACDAHLVLFSSHSAAQGHDSLNEHALTCAAESFVGPAPTSTAFVNPACDQVSARWIGDLGVPLLRATIDGLGASATVDMPRTNGNFGVTYDSPTVPIDPTARGDITATVRLPDGTLVGRVTFHTVA